MPIQQRPNHQQRQGQPARRQAASRSPPAAGARAGSIARSRRLRRAMRAGRRYGRIPSPTSAVSNRGGQKHPPPTDNRVTRRREPCKIVYQNNNCNSSGRSRIRFHVKRRQPKPSSQFFDNRPMPIRVPRIVASTMPITETFNVLSTPMTRARPYVSTAGL